MGVMSLVADGYVPNLPLDGSTEASTLSSSEALAEVVTIQREQTYQGRFDLCSTST
mgnify:CR=1 FL=1